MSTVLITLTERELLQAGFLGLQREVQCLRGSRDGGNAPLDYERKYSKVGSGGLWQQHIEGAMGEFAVAKYLGLYPGAITSKDEADVGGIYEVRTRPKSFMELWIDKDERSKGNKYYILVQGSYGRYTICGWISSFEVFSHSEWFHNNEGKTSKSYWVPHGNLYSIDGLPTEIIE